MSDRIRPSTPLPTVTYSRALVAALLGLALAACDKPPPPPVSQGAPADTSREAELIARERTIAGREAAVTAKEQQEKAAAASAAAATDAEATRASAEAQSAAAARADKAKAAAERRQLAAERASTDTQAARERATLAEAEQRRREAANASTAAAARPIEVSSGTRLAIALKQALSSRTAQPGERFEAVLTSDVVAADGRVAVPAGATVVGTITDVVSGSRKIGATPMIGLRFEQLVTADGQRIPISGELDEQGASERGRDTAKILGGVAAGAVLGHQVKSDNRGKVIGGLLGGAIGAIAAKNTGTEVSLTEGAPLTILLGVPFSVRPAGTRAGG